MFQSIHEQVYETEKPKSNMISSPPLAKFLEADELEKNQIQNLVIFMHAKLIKK